MTMDTTFDLLHGYGCDFPRQEDELLCCCSFGIILWEFLTWRVPWHECGPWQVRHKAAYVSWKY